MAIKLVGTSSATEVDSNTDKALLVECRAPAFGSLGIYSVAIPTGAIAATLAANSTLFSMRWIDATRLCLIKSIRVSGIVTATITAAVPFDLSVFVARNFTVSDSGGTAITLSSSNQKLRTSFGASLIGDMRVSTTATLTPGTRTLDAQAIDRMQGFTGTVIGTYIFGNGTGAVYLTDRRGAGTYPVVLAQNEGIVIQNPLAGPATGSITLLVDVEWQEVSAY